MDRFPSPSAALPVARLILQYVDHTSRLLSWATQRNDNEIERQFLLTKVGWQNVQHSLSLSKASLPPNHVVKTFALSCEVNAVEVRHVLDDVSKANSKSLSRNGSIRKMFSTSLQEKLDVLQARLDEIREGLIMSLNSDDQVLLQDVIHQAARQHSTDIPEDARSIQQDKPNVIRITLGRTLSGRFRRTPDDLIPLVTDLEPDNRFLKTPPSTDSSVWSKCRAISRRSYCGGVADQFHLLHPLYHRRQQLRYERVES